MEYKHFSHNHALIYHQMPQGTEIQCSGCNSPGSGPVYVCWQCSYFLHDQCYRASRSLKHPSHPLHPLTLVPYPTYPSNSFYCNTCNLLGSGFSYSCSDCDFDLHIHCAHETLSLFHNYPNYPSIYYGTQHFIDPQLAFPIMPPNYAISPQASSYHESIHHNAADPSLPPSQPLPPLSNQSKPQDQVPVQISLLSNPLKIHEIKHFSHPHALYLQEIKEKSAKICSGCEDDLSDQVYSCIESECNFNLHKSCFELPREIRHKSHLDHPLNLLAKLPSSKYEDGKFACNACLQDGAAFVYNCSICSFDLHVECVSLPEIIKRPDHKHPLKLFYSNPVPKAEKDDQQELLVEFICNVCRNPVNELAWTYYCHECDFGTHLECAAFEVQPAPEKSEAELIRETEMKLALLQILMNGGLEAEGGGKEIRLQSTKK